MVFVCPGALPPACHVKGPITVPSAANTVTECGFVGARLVHAGLERGSCTRAARRITLTTVGGATRVIRKLGSTPSGLDFDGTYVVYAVPLRAGSTRSPQVVYRQRVR